MLASVRAGFAAALVAFFSFTAFAADKPFQRSDLADSAIRLETQIKTESGQVAKPVATLRSEAEAAFAKRDFRAGMQTLAQIVSVAPREAGNWLRLSRAILQIRPNDDRERTNFLERAATAAYIAYQRSGNVGEEADALVLLGRTFADRKLWRPALDAYRHSLDLRELAEVRQSYEQLRDQHGFRILDYSVDADAASPRACFQFSEELPGKRTDFSPFVALEGTDKPAHQHGRKAALRRRSEAWRALFGHAARRPAVDREGDAAEIRRLQHLCARPQPLCALHRQGLCAAAHRPARHSGGQRQHCVGEGEDPPHRRPQSDRHGAGQRLSAQHRPLRPPQARIREGRARLGRRSEDRHVLNADVTTAFPIDQAIGDLKPGVYVMTAEPEGRPRDEDYGQLATQWFVVSDLGLTAFSGNDGINVFLHSLATTEAKAGIEIRLIARNNEVLAARTTDAAGFARFEAGFARGEGGLSPAMLVADGKGDYAFLSLKGPAFDLTDRGVAGRTVTAGLDAFVYAERGVYRTGETVHLTTLLRDAQGVAVTGVPMTLVVDRPDGVEYRRTVVQDQGIGGRSLSFPMISSAPTGTYRVRAYTDPKGAVDRLHQLPGRRLCAGSHGVRSRLADRQCSPRQRRPK